MSGYYTCPYVTVKPQFVYFVMHLDGWGGETGEWYPGFAFSTRQDAETYVDRNFPDRLRDCRTIMEVPFMPSGNMVTVSEE